MDLTQIALQLWPCWIMGILMIYFTLTSKYKKLVRVQPKSIFKFVKFLAIVFVFRFLAFKFLLSDATMEQARDTARLIPWPATLGVFWEDACHSMPLVLASLMFRKSQLYSWLSKPILAVVMLSFACGHMYQGFFPAMAISLYVPFSMKMGIKHGFGSMMICHILYDMTTLLSVKFILG